MEKYPRRDLFPGALEMMVLQILLFEPLHGYALAQRIKQMSNDLLRVEEGSLYPSLQRLLKQGHLEAEWTQSATNRRIRVYRVTRSGIKHLEGEISSFERMLEGISLVLAPAKS
jgi:PadR family transcriptional regulator, regulatory protein PadR